MTDAVNQPANTQPAPGTDGAPAPSQGTTQPVNTQAAPTPEPTPAPQPTADTAFSFESTGNPRTDLALEFFGKQGIKPDSFEIQRAVEGDFGPLKAYLGARGDKAKGFENYLALAEDAYNEHVKGTESAREERQKVVYEAVGGEDNWNNIQAWVEKSAPKEDIEVLKKAISQGGIAARAVASFLANEYSQAAGTISQPKPATTQNAPSVSQQPLPLTIASYRQEVAALQAKIGSNQMDASPEYAALRQKYANVRS